MPVPPASPLQHLSVDALDGVDEATFQQTAEKAKNGCPVSQLLKPGLEEMTLKATLQK